MGIRRKQEFIDILIVSPTLEPGSIYPVSIEPRSSNNWAVLKQMHDKISWDMESGTNTINTVITQMFRQKNKK